MTFQIQALDMTAFHPLFSLSQTELADRNIDMKVVDEYPGFPCRVSMQDVPIGEKVALLNYCHLSRDTPYQASHAIFVWENATQAHPQPGFIPDVIARRLISVRGFNAEHRMVAADIAEGSDLSEVLNTFFKDQSIDYIHLHNAKQGCFSAKVTRAS